MTVDTDSNKQVVIRLSQKEAANLAFIMDSVENENHIDCDDQLSLAKALGEKLDEEVDL